MDDLGMFPLPLRDLQEFVDLHYYSRSFIYYYCIFFFTHNSIGSFRGLAKNQRNPFFLDSKNGKKNSRMACPNF